MVLFKYKPEGGESLLESRNPDLTENSHGAGDIEMNDGSAPAREQQIKFPCLQYITELTAFEPEVDYVKDYEIAPGITSIEWLNRYSLHSTMSFVAANDKKIRLIKLRKDFCDEFRTSNSPPGSMNSANYGQFGGGMHAFDHRNAQIDGGNMS